MTSSQAGGRVLAKRWILFLMANLLLEEVCGLGMWLGTSSCLPHFRPVPAPGEGGDEGQHQESCISARLACGSLSQAGLEQLGARQGDRRLSGQECRRMWGQGPFSHDESCRSPAGCCCVWQQRWCRAGKGRRAEQEEMVTTAWCRQRWKVQGHTGRSHQSSACSLWQTVWRGQDV